MNDKAKTIYDIVKLRQQLEDIIEKQIMYGSGAYSCLIEASVYMSKAEEKLKKEL